MNSLEGSQPKTVLVVIYQAKCVTGSAEGKHWNDEWHNSVESDIPYNNIVRTRQKYNHNLPELVNASFEHICEAHSDN